MRAVYLALVVALFVVLATLEVVAERRVSAVYPEPRPAVYDK